MELVQEIGKKLYLRKSNDNNSKKSDTVEEDSSLTGNLVFDLAALMTDILQIC